MFNLAENKMKFCPREKTIMSEKQKYLRILAEIHTRLDAFLYLSEGQVVLMTPLFNPFLPGN